MAEAFLRLYGGERFEAHSAGLEPAPIHPYTLEVMAEVGIDLIAAGHRSKSLIDEYFEKQVYLGYLITVCNNSEAK
jgi:arsenate reductase